jgi:Histidine kinase-like ATPase domain
MGSSTGDGRWPRLSGEASRKATVPATAPASVLRWRQVFSGEERRLRDLRHWLASLLPACPARDDVISVATELGSNAVQHTASGHGGWFAVEITWHQSVVWVAVADGGGPAEPQVIEDPSVEHGRGLLLVRGLSARTGVVGDQRGRLVWAQIAWDAPLTAAHASSHDPYEVAIRDGAGMLARRFGDVPSWFGRSTLTWWALAGPGELVSAPSAPKLAALLYRLDTSPSPRLTGISPRRCPDEACRGPPRSGPFSYLK